MSTLTCPVCGTPVTLTEAGSDQALCSSCGTSFPVKQAQTRTTAYDHRRLGKFDLLEEVGSGAFGVVWKAMDRELDRVVAVKVPHSGHLTEGKHAERFLREARSAAQLRHPGIVSVHEVAYHEGLPYLVEDFVDGVTLGDLLKARPFAFRVAAELVAQLADAIGYAHAMGVVHRDLKPSNVMLERSGLPGGLRSDDPTAPPGKPLITDFGLAVRLETDAPLTLEGQALGTPAYMSPEQARGDRQGTDGRTDVYSLGVVLYQLLAGKVPFEGNPRMIIDQVLRQEPPPPRAANAKVPRDLETIALKCLRKEPERRYDSAGELADDLRRWLHGEPIKARPLGTMERLVRWARRNPGVAGLTAAVGLLLLAVAGVALATAVHVSRLNTKLGSAKDEADRKAEDEKAARNEADAQAEKSRRLLVRQFVARATQLLNQDNPIAALPWLAEALRLEQGKPDEGIQRLRLGMVLKSCPRVVHVRDDPLVSYVRFSPDGSRLLLITSESGEGSLELHVIDAETGQSLFPALKHDLLIRQVSFSPDGSRIVTLQSQGEAALIRGVSAISKVQVWDATDGKPLGRLLTFADKPLASQVRFHPDGRRLLLMIDHGGSSMRSPLSPATKRRQDIRLVDPETGKDVMPPISRSGTAFSTLFAQDGSRLALLTSLASFGETREGTVEIFDTTTGKATSPPIKIPSSSTLVEFDPDKQWLLTISTKDVDIWHIARAAKVQSLKHDAPVQHAAFTNIGRHVHTISAGQSRWWDTVSGKLLYTRGKFDDGQVLVYFSDDHRRWLTGRVAGPGNIIGTRRRGGDWSRIIGKDLDLLDPFSGNRLGPVLPHATPVSLLVLAPEGRRLVSTRLDTTTGRCESRLWDLASPQAGKHVLPRLLGFGVSPDARVIAYGRSKERVERFDGLPVTVLDTEGVPRDLIFSRDRKRLVTLMYVPGGGSPLGIRTEIRVWDARGGAPIGKPFESPGLSGRVALSPDARLVAVGHGQQILPKPGKGLEVTLHEVETGRRVGQLFVVVGGDPYSNLLGVQAVRYL